MPPTAVEDYFQYKPNVALNSVALGLFAAVSAVIAVQTVKYKQKYMWIVVFTGCLEVAGYVSRLIASKQVNLGAYIANLVFIILAPNFLALANYVTVGKIAERLELSGRFLNTKSISIGFFVIDIICIAVQGGGSASISSTLQEAGVASETGTRVVLVGLAVQLFFFASFTVVTAYVYYLQRTKAARKVPLLLYVGLTATILLITLRNIYRVIEIAVSDHAWKLFSSIICLHCLVILSACAWLLLLLPFLIACLLHACWLPHTCVLTSVGVKSAASTLRAAICSSSSKPTCCCQSCTPPTCYTTIQSGCLSGCRWGGPENTTHMKYIFTALTLFQSSLPSAYTVFFILVGTWGLWGRHCQQMPG